MSSWRLSCPDETVLGEVPIVDVLPQRKELTGACLVRPTGANARGLSGLQMVGCMVVKGEEMANDGRVINLHFSQTICNGVVIKDGLADLSDPESTVRLEYVITAVEFADVACDGLLDAIDSALVIAEIILTHRLTIKQSELAWAFVEWLATFIKPVSAYRCTLNS